MASTSAPASWSPPQGRYNAADDMVDGNIRAGRAGKLAFVDQTRSLTYGQLAERVNRVANALPRLGIAREARIVLIMLDTVDLPSVFWGAIKCGAVPVPLNTLLPPETWRFMIEDSCAAAVVISPDLYARAGHMLQEIARVRHLHVIIADKVAPANAIALEPLLASSDPAAQAAETYADDVAFWLYSSGSTGTPKGTRHVHGSPAHTAHCFGQGVLGFK